MGAELRKTVKMPNQLLSNEGGTSKGGGKDSMKFQTTIFFFLVAASIGCSQQLILLSALDQKDANEIMVLLHRNGIETKRTVVEKQQEMTWTLSVASRDENRARELLVANHLPREKQLGLKGICKEAGLIPTPKTEKCRELLAL